MSLPPPPVSTELETVVLPVTRRVRAAAKRYGLPLKTLLHRMEVDPVGFRRWESGAQHDMLLSTYCRICRVLDELTLQAPRAVAESAQRAAEVRLPLTKVPVGAQEW